MYASAETPTFSLSSGILPGPKNETESVARSFFRHPLTKLYLGALAGHFSLVLAAPELWLRLAAKEGPFEHVGHAVLLLAALGWLRASVRNRARARLLAIMATSYLVLALLEEVDWGAVYGWNLGHATVERLTHGSPNFHNAQTTHSSLFGWSVVWMSGPMVAFFGAPLVPLPGWRRLWRSCSPVATTPVEGLVFLAAAVISVVVDGLPLLEHRLGYVPRAGAGDPIGAPLGFFQIFFYFAWLFVAWRASARASREPV